MLSLPDMKNAQEVTAWLREIVRSLQHPSRHANLVLFGLSGFAAAWWVRSDQAKQFGSYWFGTGWQRFSETTSLILIVVGGAFIGWAALRIWREATPPPDTADVVRPTVIKGPLSFGPFDSAIFRRLGRENDTAALLNLILNDQIGLIIIKGDSGAGKTSLLRAGLPGLLANQTPPIAYAYWEAIPDQAEKGLLSAVKAEWVEGPEAPVPQKLADLNAILPRAGRRVIVLDQFEQLSPSKSEHDAIFQLLEYAVVQAMPPHRLTYVVAFRADYSSTWLNFQWDRLGERFPTIMPLRLFNHNQAKDIIAVISDAAGFTIDNALVDELVASMKNDDDCISPVDIGITLLALNERALTKENRHLDKGDYRIAGGATGLLADYISSVLDRYRVDERSTVVHAMLELADLSNDKRLAQGLPPDELAGKVKMPAAALQRYLRDLASTQIRLLEFLSSSGTYRLAHERLIPALRQLAGLVLARAEQAGRAFDRAYSEWVAGQRGSRQLLGGRILSEVMKYRTQLQLGMNRDDKETFLKRSLAWRAWQRTAAGAAAFIMFGVVYFGWHELAISEAKHDLENWRLPTALVNTDALNTLFITNDRLTNLHWLNCGFKELLLSIPKVDDLEDLRRCRGLVSLGLDFFRSLGSIGDLDVLKELKTLNALALDLRTTGIASLDALKELKGLNVLDLNLSGVDVNNLDALKELKSLNNLMLNLGGSGVRNVDGLKELKGLNTLTIVIGGATVSSLDASKELNGLDELTLDLDALKELKGLHELTLDLSRGDSLPDVLKELKSLNKLTLDLQESRVGSLDALKELKGLNNLSLDLRSTHIASLDALKELKGLNNLTLDLRKASIGSLETLKELKSLNNVTLYLGGSGVDSLDALKELKDLNTLSVDLLDGNVLNALKSLKSLTLDLRGRNVRNLDALKELKGLKTLTLDLRDTDVSNLDALKEFKGLDKLTLYLTGTNVGSLDALKELKGLNTLTLDLRGTDISNLDALKEFKGLNDLRLSLGRKVGSLDALKEFKGLNTLALDFLGNNVIGSLDVLKELKDLNNLTLTIGGNVGSLDALRELGKLETLRVFSYSRYNLGAFPKALRRLEVSDRSQGADI